MSLQTHRDSTTVKQNILVKAIGITNKKYNTETDMLKRLGVFFPS